MAKEDQIEVPSNLLINVPTNSPLFKTDKGNDGNLSEDEKNRLADEALKKSQQGNQGTQANQGQQGNSGKTNQQNQEPELTDEQIQSKLDEIGNKEEKDWTEDEKTFVEKYTQQEETSIALARNSVAEKYSIDFKDKQYEDSPQGLIQLINDAAPKVAQQMLIEHLQQVPKAKELYEHLLSGRGIETFMLKNQKPAFELIELKEITADLSDDVQKQYEENHKQLIRLNLASKGVDPDTIETIIDVATSKGKLFEEAKKAKGTLQKEHAAILEARLKQEDAAKQAEEQAIEEEYNKALSMFDKNDFGNGLAVPPGDLKTFKDAYLNVDDRGYSIIDYKRAKLTLGQRIFIDDLVHTDFKGANYKKSTQNKQFTFKQAAKDNDARGAGRLRGAGGNGNNDGKNNIVDIKDFLSNINKQTG